MNAVVLFIYLIALALVLVRAWWLGAVAWRGDPLSDLAADRSQRLSLGSLLFGDPRRRLKFRGKSTLGQEAGRRLKTTMR